MSIGDSMTQMMKILMKLTLSPFPLKESASLERWKRNLNLLPKRNQCHQTVPSAVLQVCPVLMVLHFNKVFYLELGLIFHSFRFFISSFFTSSKAKAFSTSCAPRYINQRELLCHGEAGCQEGSSNISS